MADRSDDWASARAAAQISEPRSRRWCLSLELPRARPWNRRHEHPWGHWTMGIPPSEVCGVCFCGAESTGQDGTRVDAAL